MQCLYRFVLEFKCTLLRILSFTILISAQILRPSAGNSSHIRVFQADGEQVLSVDVSNSNVAVYSGMRLTITGTSSPFFTTRTYYLLADTGLCVCVGVCVCVRECVCVV